MTLATIENGAASANSNPKGSAEMTLSTHCSSRETTLYATHWPAKDRETSGRAEAYISLTIQAEKNDHEKTDSEREGYCRLAAETTVYMSVEQARELHSDLTRALACADVK